MIWHPSRRKATSYSPTPPPEGCRPRRDTATVVPLSPAQRRAIKNFLNGSVSLQDVLQRSARLLASITGQVAVVASPALSKSALRHVEIVQVAANVLLAVVITDTGSVAQHMLTVDPVPTVDQLERFCAIVNTRCSGLSLARTAENTRALIPQVKDPALKQAAEMLARAFTNMAEDEQAGQLYMAGTSRLTHQQKITDLAPLLDALEEQVVIMKLMSALSEEASNSGLGVAIGSETHTPGLLNASVVSGGYGHSRTPRGSHTDNHDDGSTDSPVAFVGSIGPTHMDYAATMAAVRAVARYLTEFISNEAGE